MKEVWKDIKGYESLYQVSNLGRVKSLPKNSKNQYSNERILKPYGKENDYCRIILTKNKKKKSYYIHRLVAETFLSNPYQYEVVNHKDENKHNNNAHNLEWCSTYYNQIYGTKNIRSAKKRGKKVIQYDLQGNFIKEWESISQAEKSLKIFNISNCIKGQTRYKNVGGFIWKAREGI